MASETRDKFLTKRLAERGEEVERLRSAIRALIEVYAPSERKAVLRREHLKE
jgi:hypothetical protein